MRRAFALACLAVAVLAAGCGSAQERAGSLPRGDFTLAEARAFDDFPLVWAGPRVDDLPLVAIVRRDDTARFVSFVYGDCLAAGDLGCAPPAEIQVWPADARNLASYDTTAVGARGPTPVETRIRGSPAAFLDDGTRLEIYTDDSTVVVFAHSRQRVLAIAQALRCLTKGGAEAPARRLDC